MPILSTAMLKRLGNGGLTNVGTFVDLTALNNSYASPQDGLFAVVGVNGSTGGENMYVSDGGSWNLISGGGSGGAVDSVNGQTGIVVLTKSDVGLGNVTNDAQTKAAIVPNTAPSAGQMLVGNSGGTAYAPVSLSNDATIASNGALTLANTAVTPGSYTTANITVDAKGRITAAASGTATGGHTIQDEGVSLAQRTKLNFVGAGVTATDDAGNDATVVTITGSGAANAQAVFTGDGSTTVFTLPTVAADNKAIITLNGNQSEPTTDYSISGTSLTFVTAPPVGWKIVASFSTPANNSGDVSSNTATSTDSEVALFNGTTGKSIKRATGTGIAKLTSGVLGTATPGTDYLAPAGSGAALTGITATQVGLGNVTNDAQTKAAIVPNTVPSTGQLLVGNAGGTAYAPVSSSGDATVASTGAITVTKSTNVKGGNSTTLLGAIPYQSDTDTTSLLAPNTTSTKNVLTQTGTGTNGAAPAWGILAYTDITNAQKVITSGTAAPSGGSDGDIYLQYV